MESGEISLAISKKISLILLLAQVCTGGFLFYSLKRNGLSFFTIGWDGRLNKDLYWGILFGVSLAAIYIHLVSPIHIYLQTTLGDYIPPGETINEFGEGIFPFFLANVIFAPFVEESLYRNFALRTFGTAYSPKMSVLLSSVLFGMFHWLGGFWYILITMIVIGIPFAYIAGKRGNLFFVFIAHLTLNSCEFLYVLFR